MTQTMAYRDLKDPYTLVDDYGTKRLIRRFASVPLTKTGAVARIPNGYRPSEILTETIWRDEEGNLYREVTPVDFSGGGFYRSGTAPSLSSMPWAPCEIDGALYKTYKSMDPLRARDHAVWKGETA